MLVDTHCHINMMVKREFDVPLQPEEITAAKKIIDDAAQHSVTTILNVGTSVVESKNCVVLAQEFPSLYAAVGIHPNDCTEAWRDDFKEIENLVRYKEGNKIVAIGECGLDFHYPDFKVQRQKDAFKAQIELALEHDVSLVVHTRQAPDETLRVLEEFSGQARGVIHCFSESLSFAQQVIEWGFFIGIGGTVTYPKNDPLRNVVQSVNTSSIVLETDAPFLPPQPIRGKQNNPLYIKMIAEYVAELKEESFESIAQTTTANAHRLMSIGS
jgi:TatD DNase family protein